MGRRVEATEEIWAKNCGKSRVKSGKRSGEKSGEEEYLHSTQYSVSAFSTCPT